MVSLWVKEKLKADCTLVLVPSLSLLRQTIGEWLQHRKQEFQFLAVCSDDTVRNQDGLIEHAAELGLPATTDSDVVAAFPSSQQQPTSHHQASKPTSRQELANQSAGLEH